MSDNVKYVTLLYLLNQDTSSLSLEELYALYREKLKEVDECEKTYKKTHKQDTFSFE